VSSPTGKNKCGKKKIEPVKSYLLPLAEDVAKDDERDSEISRPDQQIGDDVQPTMEISPPSTMPAGRPVGMVKKLAEEFGEFTHGNKIRIAISVEKKRIAI
jgi:hypothetical protein